MARSITFMVIIVGVLCFAQAETVSLSGTVKKSGGTAGIAGVKVSLAKLKDISATTDASGAFTISAGTPVLSPFSQLTQSQVFLRGATLVFSPGFPHASGCVEFFSSDGKKINSIPLRRQADGKHEIAVPRIGSGITVVRLSLGAESFTHTLVRLGNELFLRSEAPSSASHATMGFSKQTTAKIIDTLVAAKDGYTTQKTPIETYTKQNIAITLDTAGGNSGGPCTRAALEAIAAKYIEAQKAGDPTKMPLASGATWEENFKTVTTDKSLCKTALKIDTTRVFCDVDSCIAFVEAISANNTPPYVFLSWLKVDNGQVAYVRTIFTTTGDWLFDAKKYLTYNKPQDWNILPEADRIPRQQLINGANAYLDAFVPETKSDTIPWGVPCERIEGGTSTGSGPNSTCNVGVPSGVKITARTYAVDVERGVVDCFCKFGGGMPDSHMFRMIKGKYRYVHTLSVQN
jgi:hypothetical protein